MDPMNPDLAATVAIVDDDPGVRDSLRVLLAAAGYHTREYASAEAFLREPLEGQRCCAIVDLRLPGLDGLALQAEMGRRGLATPLIVVTAHGDVASARQALRAGAVDFLEKPIDNDELLAAVRGAIEGQDRAQIERAADARATLLLASLTQREREVYERIVRGMHNREIAVDLGISPRTVEVHRARVMAKLKARRLADLLRLRPLAPVPERALAEGARADR
ncbi:MAG: DNA-binding response regulator [Betaproteobacteria bacterium]|nr:MAG: DNA-binding response regulator [Betaproteobacteria bacterium]